MSSKRDLLHWAGEGQAALNVWTITAEFGSGDYGLVPDSRRTTFQTP